jgi:gliding motility associated protien GldN
MIMKKKILLIVLCVACTASFAQTKKRRRKKPATATTQAVTPPANTALNAQPAVDTTKKIAAAPLKPFDRPLDGYYKKSDILNAKVVPYASIREADVAYSKRIWREIDLREKMNAYLISPKARLIDVLMTAIANGELTAYDATADPNVDPDGDSFARPLTPQQARNAMVDSSAVDDIDKNTGEKIGSHMVAGDFVGDSVVKFRLKEDWIFDRQRSVLEPRIIGLAPMKKVKIPGQEDRYQPAFWIYFPDARQILANKEVVNKNSDATDLSFDDVFMKRIFTSYIVKASNDKDESIKDYAQGIDKLYESERIKKKLMDYELDLWKYNQ